MKSRKHPTIENIKKYKTFKNTNLAKQRQAQRNYYKEQLQVWLYVFLGCTRACMCGCDGDVVCVGHDLNRCTGWW